MSRVVVSSDASSSSFLFFSLPYLVMCISPPMSFYAIFSSSSLVSFYFLPIGHLCPILLYHFSLPLPFLCFHLYVFMILFFSSLFFVVCHLFVDRWIVS